MTKTWKRHWLQRKKLTVDKERKLVISPVRQYVNNDRNSLLIFSYLGHENQINYNA